MLRNLALASVISLLVFADGAAAAECDRSAVNPDPVLIEGAIGEADSLAGRIEVTSGKAGVLRASDLKGPEAVPAARVSAGEPIAASSDGLPVVRTVTLTGITQPGKYVGTLTLVTSGSECTIQLQANVVARPQLVALGGDEKSATVKITRDGIQTLSLPLRNAGPGEVQIDGATLLLRHADLRQVAKGITATAPERTIGPGGVGYVPLAVTKALKAGDYSGALEIKASDATTLTAIPVTIKVKKSLLWALILILIGCALRFVVQFAARGRTLAGPARTLSKLRRRAKALDPKYREALTPLLDRLSRTIYIDRDRDAAAALSATVEDLQKSLSRAQLAGATPPPGHESEWEDLQEKLLKAVEDEDPEEARQIVPRIELLAEKRERPMTKGARALRGGGLELSPGLASTGPRTVAVAADEVRAAFGWFAIFVLPALVQVLTIAVLAFLGLKALYLSNDTFGADFWLDDIGLVVWTLGANAAGIVLGALVPKH
ncbi:MAG: hypothetical protein QOI80_3062 [Solirubrobacteraceae bacterium]|nr:hypothetical protein [Solirubrobacteraceae bacterium]